MRSAKHVIIIAEAGVNHNGSAENAFRMIDAAADAGADYVKFQTFKAEKLANTSAAQADYQKRNTGCSESQLDMLRRLELGDDTFRELQAYCVSKGIGFLSTPFDIDSVRFLASLGMDYMKIPSGEITNLPYLRAVAATGLPVIMSTGMCTNDDIRAALDALLNGGLTIGQISLLHCNTQYPTPMSDVNLRAMESLRSAFGTDVGYSDHTLGIEVPIAAVALGATVIEKHFTLDRTMPGPDHKASLEPAELKAMVHAIRNIEHALGSPDKHVTPSEDANIAVARKSIVAARHINKGEVLSDENLCAKRPGTGISPMRWDEVCGQHAIRDFEKDEIIEI